MRIHELSPKEGPKKKRKRVGRGPGSGHGKTACRGHKGQRSRSGSGARPGFEGGQMPLQRRLPKRGFNNPFRKVYQIVNIGDLDRFESQTEVDRRILREAGLIRRKGDGVKLLGNGEITKPLVVKVDKVSPAAKSKIEAAGGKIEAV